MIFWVYAFLFPFCQKIFAQQFRVSKLLLCFFLNILLFYLSLYIHNTRIHFVSGVRYSTRFFFFHMAIRLTRPHLLKWSSFPRCIAIPPWTEIRQIIYVCVFWPLSSATLVTLVPKPYHINYNSLILVSACANIYSAVMFFSQIAIAILSSLYFLIHFRIGLSVSLTPSQRALPFDFQNCVDSID